MTIERTPIPDWAHENEKASLREKSPTFTVKAGLGDIATNTVVHRVERVDLCEGPHCWHYASMQHTVMHHRDEVCCNCGLERCVNTWDEDSEARKGHGRFMP